MGTAPLSLASATMHLRSLIEASQTPGHLYGSLETHLVGTAALLIEWRASMPVCTAGLFHAAYGTSGWSDQLLGIAERARLQTLIGREAEQLVYLHCACDRATFYPALSAAAPPLFRDRFSDTSFTLGQSDLSGIALLTAANELELLSREPSHWRRYGDELQPLLSSPYFRELLSEPARTALAARLAELHPSLRTGTSG